MGLKFIVLIVATVSVSSAVAYYLMEKARAKDVITIEDEE